MKGMKAVPHQVGLVFGGFLGIAHAFWAVLVAVGFAQTLLDWVFRLHFLSNPYTISPFDLGTAATLVIVTSLVGYTAGWVFGSLWRCCAMKK